MKDIIKAQLSRLKFRFGEPFQIEKNNNFRKFIPNPYKAVLLFQTDFELAWAWQYSKTESNSYKFALKKATLERENVPVLISLCERYNIPITWLTVGHLFIDSCKKEIGLAHNSLPRLKHFSSNYWNFVEGDWFQFDPCSNLKEDPEWYAKDLIQQIISSKVIHEIGCHTFAHIDCRDEVCPPKVFKADIQECISEAKKFNIDMKSFVHPAHTIGNLDSLCELGFTSYRSDNGYYLCMPMHYKNQLWELKSSSAMYERRGWSYRYHAKRYIETIKKAIKHNTVCVLWFHPSESKGFIAEVFSKVFEFVDAHRDELYTATTGEYIKWLNKNNNNE